MADAGRILIIPRGDYNANSTYDKLDLVKYKGTSWLAKKDTTGIEPTEGEYWQKIFDLGTANNLTTTEEGFALDARQGKVLNDKVIGINNNLNSWKIYNSPAELGIAVGTETIEAICVAMADKSEMRFQKNSSNPSKAYPVSTGVLNILKNTSTRVEARYFHGTASDGAREWVGYYDTNITPNFTGWSEVVKDGAWVELSIADGFELFTSGTVVKCKKVGDVVYLKGSVKPVNNLDPNTTTTVATLPIGYRPVIQNAVFVCQGSGINRWCLSITTGGSVRVERYGTISDNGVPAGAWLTFDVSFTTT